MWYSDSSESSDDNYYESSDDDGSYENDCSEESGDDLSCDVCGISSDQMSNLTNFYRHMDGNHHKENAWQYGEYHCPICDIWNLARGSYWPHMEGKKHRKRVETLLGSCEYEQNEVMSEPEVFRCEECDLTLNSRFNLEQHLNGRRHHERLQEIDARFEPEVFRCEECDLTLNSRFNLEQHLNGRRHHERLQEIDARFEPEVFRCEECDLTLNSRFNLEQHLNGRRHHERLQEIESEARFESPKVFRCEECDLTLNSRFNLEQHLNGRKHHERLQKIAEAKGPQRLGFYCDLCNCTMYNENSYSNHMNGREHWNVLQEYDGYPPSSESSYYGHINGKRHWATMREIFDQKLHQVQDEQHENNKSEKQKKQGIENQWERDDKESKPQKQNLVCELCGISALTEMDMVRHMNGKDHYAKLKVQRAADLNERMSKMDLHSSQRNPPSSEAKLPRDSNNKKKTCGICNRTYSNEDAHHLRSEIHLRCEEVLVKRMESHKEKLRLRVTLAKERRIISKSNLSNVNMRVNKYISDLREQFEEPAKFDLHNFEELMDLSLVKIESLIFDLEDSKTYCSLCSCWVKDMELHKKSSEHDRLLQRSLPSHVEERNLQIEKECSICYDHINNGRCFQCSQCFIKLHSNCWRQWCEMHRERECPSCKKKYQ
eukprot:TRINITY_DN2927_c0_g1_i1.p1 TRINITY_DN2927_c0_g1~~TRINITY_DN2927_c0_g1_i1.p1  ORF type:complete len:659 (-),score=126.45 TRINITY_DN2927_c0_g1_i1:357-2333(-)